MVVYGSVLCGGFFSVVVREWGRQWLMGRYIS